jgi:hypothetical protein
VYFYFFVGNSDSFENTTNNLLQFSLIAYILARSTPYCNIIYMLLLKARLCICMFDLINPFHLNINNGLVYYIIYMYSS